MAKITTKSVREETKLTMGIDDSYFEYRGKKFSVNEMSAAFDAVKNPNHWKDIIIAIIDEKDREVTAAAIVFYTATEMKIRSRHEIESTGEVKLVIEADGYWKGPAN